jgi:hypothetical protein
MGLFANQSPAMTPPAPVIMPPQPTQADAGQFARASRAAGGRAQGFESNIKTSSQGVMGEAPRAAKTFLGE